MRTFVVAPVLFGICGGFSVVPRLGELRQTRLASQKESEDAAEGATKVGSKEYYEGFLESPIIDPSLVERDPNGGLDQALKLGATASAVLALLFVGFMKSNGLL
ncbi:hypothetical protein M885DRAFT_510914 [Pelagophyceae sp. CCMP2097]|nr:hypothetical protein M885DRAFT_510914 [Pelagophyceae sp. CCMP2097]